MNASQPTVLIQPSRGLFHLDLASVWRYRELLFFLVWRDVKVRYKQTVLGATWAILQPIVTMIVFTVIFGHFARIPSEGLPYPVFAYAALLPWNFFAQAMARSGNSLLSDGHLITKVYFPRLIIPLAATLTPAVDLAFSLVPLLGLMVWFGIRPSLGILALPLFLFFAMFTALSIGLWLSPINVRYRDVAYVLPFLTQSWMYASPIVYPITLVPERWQWLYCLNPMVGVIEGFRWALLGQATHHFGHMAISACAVVIVFLGGIVFFRRMERTFADVV